MCCAVAEPARKVCKLSCGMVLCLLCTISGKKPATAVAARIAATRDVTQAHAAMALPASQSLAALTKSFGSSGDPADPVLPNVTYSGFLPVDPEADSQMFYTYHEAQEGAGSSVPIILWLEARHSRVLFAEPRASTDKVAHESASWLGGSAGRPWLRVTVWQPVHKRAATGVSGVPQLFHCYYSGTCMCAV